MPDICFAIKCPINEIQSKEWPDLAKLADEVLDTAASELKHEQKDSTTNEPVTGPLYHTKSQINLEEVEVNHSEAEINNDDKHSLHPLVFYRLAKPLKKGKELPAIDLSLFYKTNTTHEIAFEFVPDLTFQKNNKLLTNTKEQWDEVQDNYKKYKIEYKKEMLNHLDKQVKSKLSSEDLDKIELDKVLKVSEMEFEDKNLKKLAEKIKKQQLALYWALNVNCYNILPYRSGALKDFDNSFAQLVAKNKSTLLTSIKSKVI